MALKEDFMGDDDDQDDFMSLDDLENDDDSDLYDEDQDDWGDSFDDMDSEAWDREYHGGDGEELEDDPWALS